jgi:PKD repeat protein
MTQRYEPAIQEDLNVGVNGCFVAAPTGGELRAVQFGLHTVARGQKAHEASWTPGAILTTGKASTTVSVPDAAEGDLVLASHDKILTSDLRISGHVSAAGTVKVVVHNPTASTVTVSRGTVSVIVFPFIGLGAAPPPDPPDASFTWTQSGVTEIAFTDTSTAVSPATVVSWAWNLGDGVGSSTDQNPTYDYGTYGTFTVVLTVTDSNGLTDSYSEDVSVLGT